MPEKDALETLCPQCKNGAMLLLKRIAHADTSITLYLRCAGCSHIEIVREQPTKARPD
jgi:DNA-directed RNA polymerase subunit M/transcription elongation factor TFIIS